MAYDLDKESEFIDNWADPIADEIFALIRTEMENYEIWARENINLDWRSPEESVNDWFNNVKNV